jgi:hypothetical protein
MSQAGCANGAKKIKNGSFHDLPSQTVRPKMMPSVPAPISKTERTTQAPPLGGKGLHNAFTREKTKTSRMISAGAERNPANLKRLSSVFI